MATETLRPSATGDNTQLTPDPAEDANWECIDEVVADDNDTKVYTKDSSYLRDLYNIADHSVGSGDINHIVVYARVRAYTTPTQASLKIAIKSGTGGGAPDTVDEGDAITLADGWTNESEQWTKNPATTNDWTWDEIDKLQIGLALRKCATNQNSYCTQVYVEVDYSLPLQTLEPSSVASVEAFGSHKVNLKLTVSAIGSLEAFGTAKLNLRLTLSAITSAEAFGTTQLNLQIITSGIASLEAFGTLNIVIAQTISDAGGIASVEALGSSQLNLILFPTGTVSAEGFGTAQLNLTLVLSAIASGEAFGTAKIVLYLVPSGITSGEGFGTLQLNLTLILSAIASGEAFGGSTIVLYLLPTGIASSEALGSAVALYFVVDRLMTLIVYTKPYFDLTVFAEPYYDLGVYTKPYSDLKIYTVGVG